MSINKNSILPLTIESLSSDGSGVAHYDGKAIFVPATAPGDVLQARIVKDMGRYAFAIVEELTAPSSTHITPDCPVCGPCGGCCFRHLDYAEESKSKEGFVADAFARIGGLDTPILPILSSPLENRYRNKVQFPVGIDAQGHVIAGFYAGRTHRIIPCDDCKLQPEELNQIASFICAFLEKHKIPPYQEQSHSGLVRHIFLRKGWHSEEILVCLVINGETLPHSQEFCNALAEAFPNIRSIVLNVNRQKTNVITGKKNIALMGPGYIEDTMCNVPVRLGPLSFYQVNTPGAEQLYGVAREFAELQSNDTLLDLYCGMGTIGLSMVNDCKELIGVEIIPEAVSSAKANAQAMGAKNARFFCADAGQAATRLANEGLHPDVICLDPPRKGCDNATLDAVLTMAPRRIVMVSCNPATAARDCRYLADHGYTPIKVQPVDLFPRTKHVETVVQLSQRKPDDVIRVGLDLDELDITSAESKATYPELKDYILNKYGFKVSSLYIAQVKRKLGLDVGTSFNQPKSEDAKQPQCPPEKEDAIVEALKHFGMI